MAVAHPFPSPGDLWPEYGSDLSAHRPPGAYPAFPMARPSPTESRARPVSPTSGPHRLPILPRSSSHPAPPRASTLPNSTSHTTLPNPQQRQQPQLRQPQPPQQQQQPQPTASTNTVPPKPWVHDASRPCFLPPAGRSAPTPLALLHDSLEVIREYREFVDTVGRIESEYGRALAAAVRKYETRLDATLSPPIGGKKPLPPTVATAIRSNLYEVGAMAALYQKRQGRLADQLALPLGHLERHGAESTRRLGGWAKDVRGRWDYSRERVDAARIKYDESVRAHMTAMSRMKACAPPGDGDGSSSEWLRLEKVVAEAERLRADRKHAYLVALAGEGNEGGGGATIAEGGGADGWGEEARDLYAHVQSSLTALLKLHASEDKVHISLVANILERGERCFDAIDLTKDQDAFLAWNKGNGGSTTPVEEDEYQPRSSNSTATSSSEHTSESPSTPPTSTGSLQIDSCRDPSLKCYEFVAPPFARDEKPALGTEKRVDRNWLVNRWVVSMHELGEVDGHDGESSLSKKRAELDSVIAEINEYRQNRGLGDPDTLWEKRIDLRREIGIIARRAAVARAEMKCLEAVLGPLPGPELAHDFKERPFATPSACDSCKEKVWSPIKSELACRICGIALHRACELHVDPECTGLKSRRRSQGRIRRSLTSHALKLRRGTVYEAPHGGPQECRATPFLTRVEPLRDEELHISPFVTAPEEDRRAILEALAPKAPTVSLARVRFTYAATAVGELSVTAGEVVRVLEPDLDGSGWIKVRRGFEAGDEGLVPEAYLGMVGISTPPIDGGGRFVAALFDFPPAGHTLGAHEASITRFGIYELSLEGMAYDDLWCELLVPGEGGGRGAVPKTYVKAI